ncbi:MAG: redoxin family protein [Planctomycetes bacterium]|nr:redoxin family protein [Planctomycetota bacterium]
MRNFTCLLGLMLCAAAGASDAGPAYTDLAGREQRPLACAEHKATVLVFIALDCPIANRFAPELNRITEAYAARGVAVFLVHADPDVSAEAAKQHAAEFKLAAPVLLDPEQKLAQHVGATVTPEAAVLDATGARRYRGRIDDTYESFGDKPRKEPTRRDLREALDAVLAGQAVKHSETKAIGCFLPKLKPPAEEQRP